MHKGEDGRLGQSKREGLSLLMAQAMWNHGPEMLEQMGKTRVTWQKIDAKEMVDLMEYLNRGTP